LYCFSFTDPRAFISWTRSEIVCQHSVGEAFSTPDAASSSAVTRKRTTRWPVSPPAPALAPSTAMIFDVYDTNFAQST
jgi:hypothetical protein